MSFFYAIDPYRALVSLSGKDSQKFLQGLVTQDIRGLKDNAMVYTWLLNGQSRFTHDFHVILDKDDTLHLTPEKTEEVDLKSLLNLYKLNADVALTGGAESHYIVRIWGAEECPNLHQPLHPDLRHRSLGFVGICPVGAWAGMEASLIQGGGKNAPFFQFDRHRLSLAVPDGSRDLIKGRTFPLEVPGDAFGAISFSKGCYLGQELVARTKHQGAMQKTIVSYQTIGETPPTAGADIMDSTATKRGSILSVYPMEPGVWFGFARINVGSTSDLVLAQSSPLTIIQRF